MIRIELNGESYLLDDTATLEELVARIGQAHLRLAGAACRAEPSAGCDRPGGDTEARGSDHDSR